MINWLLVEEFRHKFEADCRLKGLYLIDSLEAQVSFTELSRILPISISLSSEVNEEDGLAIHKKWFGAAGDTLFTITCLPSNHTVIDFPGKREDEVYQWSFLEKLLDLPNPILKRITWIRDEFFANRISGGAKSSIYYKDRHGIAFEVYRALSEAEAEGLLNFLRRIDAGFEYWIDHPEEPNRTWIIIKSRAGGEGEIVGRYSRRSTTEVSAQFMSSRDDAVYQVREEDTGHIGLTFVRGGVSLKSSGENQR